MYLHMLGLRLLPILVQMGFDPELKSCLHLDSKSYRSHPGPIVASGLSKQVQDSCIGTLKMTDKYLLPVPLWKCRCDRNQGQSNPPLKQLEQSEPMYWWLTGRKIRSRTNSQCSLTITDMGGFVELQINDFCFKHQVMRKNTNSSKQVQETRAISSK